VDPESPSATNSIPARGVEELEALATAGLDGFGGGGLWQAASINATLAAAIARRLLAAFTRFSDHERA
jgi:hypothetical protein